MWVQIVVCLRSDLTKWVSEAAQWPAAPRDLLLWPHLHVHLHVDCVSLLNYRLFMEHFEGNCTMSRRMVSMNNTELLAKLLLHPYTTFGGGKTFQTTSIRTHNWTSGPVWKVSWPPPKANDPVLLIPLEWRQIMKIGAVKGSGNIQLME